MSTKCPICLKEFNDGVEGCPACGFKFSGNTEKFKPVLSNDTSEKERNTQDIKLSENDEIDKVYIVGFGDKDTIQYHNKPVELMKLKLAKRDTKGTKLRI